MCEWNKWGDTRIDPCMKNLIRTVNKVYPVLACCCGHNKYPMTLVVKKNYGNTEFSLELLSGKQLPHKKRFYKRDNEGHYFIPEVSEEKSKLYWAYDKKIKRRVVHLRKGDILISLVTKTKQKYKKQKMK